MGKYELSETIPKSSIVYQDEQESLDEEQHFVYAVKLSSYEIYKKYVATGCELEINISSESRQYYVRKMQKEHVWMEYEIEMQDLIAIYDQVIDEMFKLMTHSFSRFK